MVCSATPQVELIETDFSFHCHLSELFLWNKRHLTLASNGMEDELMTECLKELPL